jgi:hypothetical protein
MRSDVDSPRPRQALAAAYRARLRVFSGRLEPLVTHVAANIAHKVLPPARSPSARRPRPFLHGLLIDCRYLIEPKCVCHSRSLDLFLTR